MASNNCKRSANFPMEKALFLIPGEEYHLDHQENSQTKMSKFPLLPEFRCETEAVALNNSLNLAARIKIFKGSTWSNDLMTQKKAFENGQFEWEYRGVQLQMTSVMEDEKQVIDDVCPSVADGLSASETYDLRIAGCELIQISGQLLRLPQVAMATGQVLFQRFFHTKSFIRHDYEHYAMGCINLAAKIEECPRRLRDTINVFHHMRQAREQRPFEPLVPDQSYVNLKNKIIKTERRILKELGFCVHVKHPHKLIICYLQFLGEEKNSHLVQCAWNYMNDSLRTRVFVCYYPETIACACIYLAARQLNLPLPESPNEDVDWWNVFHVKESSMRSICNEILQLYNREKPENTKLESRILELHELRRQQLEKRQHQRDVARTKQLTGVTKGNIESQQNHNSKPKNTTSDAPDARTQNGRPFNVDECSPTNCRHKKHKSRLRTLKVNRRPTGHSHSRSSRHGKNDELSRSRHRRKNYLSSHSPSSNRHDHQYGGENQSLSRRTRYRLRSPITHYNSFGSGFRKLSKYNYYDTLNLSGGNKIRRN